MMKAIKFCLIIFCLVTAANSFGQFAYTHTPVNGSFTYNTSPTTIHAAGVDDNLSAAINIGFTFQYGCTNYTQIKVSSNGWLSFNTTLTGPDITNNLATSTSRPVLAPLWDDLAVGSAGNVNYQLTGTSPNRVLTIEWKQMEWNYSASTWAISFQCKLYEGTNNIEFVYDRNGNATANVTSASASIGISGTTSGQFYSLGDVSASPTVSTVTETTNLSSKPATGQIYRFSPVQCSGTPVAGSANSSVTITCASSTTTTLSLTGASTGCGITYQWQSSPNNSTWTNIVGATSATHVLTVSSDTYYRCVITCTNSGLSSNSSSIFVDVGNVAGIPGGYTNITLPYSGLAQTTCGAGNDLTSSNVTNICGSSSYYGGEDILYTFTPSASGNITVTMNNTSGTVGFMLYSGCPTGGGSCLGYAQSSSTTQSICVSVTSGTTYYLIIDSWPSPSCFSYDLTITAPSGVPLGTSCVSNPHIISSIPFSATNLTTCCSGNQYTSANACSSLYMDGEDYVFQYTPSTNQSINITLSNTLTYTGVFVTQGCPNSGTCVASNTNTAGNPSICGVNLTAGVTYYIIVDTWPSPNCTPFDISIQSNSALATCNLSYTSSTISYSNDSYTAGTNMTGLTDDHFAPSYTPIGFTFCFDGINYTQCLVSTNGYIIFDPVGCTPNLPGGNAVPNGSSAWSITGAIPNTTNAPRNAILAPWHDIDPSVAGNIRYQVLGTAPNRRLVISYDNIAMYSSSCNSQRFRGQVKLFETSNNIEIHIEQKVVCSSWNSGQAILGLHNYNGTIAVVPAGYNAPTQWTASNAAWRFVPSCPTCTVVLNSSDLRADVSCQKGKADISWSCGKESITQNYEVERSLDGTNFIRIASISKSPNAGQINHYSFTDVIGQNEQGITPMVYYRIKQNESTGNANYSNIVYANCSETDPVQIFPNPNEGNFTINLPEAATVVITDVFGKEISKVFFSQGEHEINLANEKSGIYLLKVLRKDSQSVVRVIKN